MAWYILLPVAILLLILIAFPKPTISPTPPPAGGPTPRKPLQVKVSIPYWDQQKAAASFMENVDVINYVSLFWYFLGSDSQIHKYNFAKEDLSIINFAHENKVKVEVVITNLPEDGGWDSDRVDKVLRNDQMRQKHIEEIVELAQNLNVDGIDIDYEQLDTDLADDFSKFIQDLGKTLRDNGKYLGVALHPKSDDGIGKENGALSQDWQAIAKGADNLYIMAFGEHWDEGEPGPIASLPWVKRIVGYALNLGINKDKLFLTIPLYGYAWEEESSRKAKGLTHNDVEKLLDKYGGEEWDESSASPHFHYENKEVWFENTRSVMEKIKLADSAGFAGITFWRLGNEDPQIWNEIGSTIKK